MVAMVAIAVIAASPSFSSFNTNQFATTTSTVAIKSGASVTNLIVPGTLTTPAISSIGGTGLTISGGTSVAISAGSITATGPFTAITGGSSFAGDGSGLNNLNGLTAGSDLFVTLTAHDNTTNYWPDIGTNATTSAKRFNILGTNDTCFDVVTNGQGGCLIRVAGNAVNGRNILVPQAWSPQFVTNGLTAANGFWIITLPAGTNNSAAVVIEGYASNPVGTNVQVAVSFTGMTNGTGGGSATFTNATSSVTGVVKPDGTIITVDGSGGITVAKGSSSLFGVVEVDNSTITASAGVISAVTGTNVINVLTNDTRALTFTNTNSVVGFGNITATNLTAITTTNDNAAAGFLGQFLNSLVASGSAVSLTTATASNVTSISLTAGDWDVEGNVNFSETTSTVTARSAGISTTTGTLPTDGSEVPNGVQSTVTSEVNGISLPRKRVSIASTTTVYLVGKATFSAGTCVGYGQINARRVR